MWNNIDFPSDLYICTNLSTTILFPNEIQSCWKLPLFPAFIWRFLCHMTHDDVISAYVCTRNAEYLDFIFENRKTSRLFLSYFNIYTYQRKAENWNVYRFNGHTREDSHFIIGVREITASTLLSQVGAVIKSWLNPKYHIIKFYEKCDRRHYETKDPEVRSYQSR